jgi:glucose-6-phosphate isomerase
MGPSTHGRGAYEPVILLCRLTVMKVANWGEPGSNGQHSFYQPVCRGARLIPCDSVACSNTLNRFGRHDDELLPHALAQGARLVDREVRFAVNLPRRSDISSREPVSFAGRFRGPRRGCRPGLIVRLPASAQNGRTGREITDRV